MFFYGQLFVLTHWPAARLGEVLAATASQYPIDSLSKLTGLGDLGLSIESIH